MDYPCHHHRRRIGSHINIPIQSIDNSLRVGAPRMPLLTESYGTDAVLVRSRIQSIEKEAYAAVLRAFMAQSDVLSWGKEGLITELRRELNVTDQEHRKLLTEIQSDEFARMIREWRKSTCHAQELPPSRMDAPGFVPSSMSNVSHKISMTSHPDVSMLQRYVSHSQPTSVANPSPFPAQYRNGGLLTYSTGNAEQPMKVVVPNVMAPSASKHRGPVKPQSKMGFYVADVDNLQKTSDIIKIRATNKLLHKVESMICGREVNPDLVQVEKAKAILMEHEVAILEVLAKLADVSDGDDSPKQFQYHDSQKELHRIGRGMATQKDLYVSSG
ncbi:Protein EMSY-LIKE 3 [Camellia lanceoleosa]|uniref:Protein EMSY-LIKE 3 n=1 Tax=Camellia lanceoleosa TaxID=1840588 RepID=A0ACC0G7K7_9ERIC|nr:Protein EMSY-LIKE 3 [Camellia lanceoleosa]